MGKARQNTKTTPEEVLEAKAAKKSGGSLREQDPNRYEGKTIGRKRPETKS